VNEGHWSIELDVIRSTASLIARGALKNPSRIPFSPNTNHFVCPFRPSEQWVRGERTGRQDL
jgi:hypothetical protein